MKSVYILILLGICLIINSCTGKNEKTVIKEKNNIEKIRYVAIGDSYTIGEGVEEGQRWPNLLTKNLKKEGINIELIANPSQTGWTTQDVIDKELDVYNKSDPNFATLLIGVNDWVKEVDSVQFRSNLAYIMDKMLDRLPSKKHLIVITIPDFSVVPEGPKYGGGRNISEGILSFNKIISEESIRRSLVVIDIFNISRGMKNDPSLIADDGLHPSPKEYQIWESLIFPAAYKAIIEGNKE